MNTEKLINWFTEILLAFENFFHQVQRWLEGGDADFRWPGRLINTDSDAYRAWEAEQPTEAE